MTSLILKRTGTETFAPSETESGGPNNSVCANLLQTFVDKPKLMGVWNLDAWNIDADFEKQHWDLDKADEVRLVESGPLRAIIRVKNHFQNSFFVRDITMYAGVPRVDVTMRAEWHEKHILLKLHSPSVRTTRWRPLKYLLGQSSGRPRVKHLLNALSSKCRRSVGPIFPMMNMDLAYSMTANMATTRKVTFSDSLFYDRPISGSSRR